MKDPKIQDLKQQAQERGLLKFDVAYPCRHGHMSPRYASTGNCVKCSADWQNEYRLRHLNGFADYSKERRAANREKSRKYIREYMIKYRATEIGRANVRKAVARYAQKIRDQQ